MMSEAEAADLRLIPKADTILGTGGLSPRERAFVEAKESER